MVFDITYLLNMSLASGIFLTQTKNAKVLPTFKFGSSLKVKKYRPTLVLLLFQSYFKKPYTR